MHPSPLLPRQVPRLVAGDPRVNPPNEPTLLITRSLTKTLGAQTFIPGRLLYGLLPASLLETYTFWQNENDTLTGYPLCDAPMATRATRLQLTLTPIGAANGGTLGSPQAVLTLSREHIEMQLADGGKAAVGGDDEASALPQMESLPSDGGDSAAVGAIKMEEHTWMVALAEPDDSKKKHSLLNMMHAPPGSPLRELGAVFMQLEYLSHILVWSETPSAGPEDLCSIDLVELPRLRLSFRVEQNPFRLCCVEHAGLVVAPPPSDPRTIALLACMPSFLLLQNASGEEFVLVSATTLPTRPALKAALFSTGVVLDRSSRSWIASCGNAPAYLYPLHVGKLSLGIPTFAAGLYLLLLRFLARDYANVFKSSEW